MEYLALFNFIYLILFFIWDNLFNNPYIEHYTLNDKTYRRKYGKWSGRWCETEREKKRKYDDGDHVDDLEILDKLNNYEHLRMFHHDNRSVKILLFLAFVNMCFIAPAIQGTWVEDMLRAA